MHKILVIEDENPVRSNLVKILQLEQLNAIGAANGQEGVDLAKEHLPDLIICDIMMPVLDGYGVRNALFQDPATAMIPFIFLTAKADKVDVRLGMSLGADDYLTKPFTRDELLEAVFVRLDKQAAVQRQMQEKMDRFRGYITTALPAELLEPITQIQSVLRLAINNRASLEPLVAEQFRDAYISSLHLERQLQNFLLYALLETTAKDPDKAKALRGSCKAQTESIIAGAAIDAAHRYGRAQDLKLELKEASVSILEDNLAKIAEELIDNAFKFSSPGATVLVKSGLEQDQFVLDVFDQGAGLTASQISELGAYVQFSRKLNGRGGAGLGLSIAKCLSELHGGHLTLESVPAKWTTARIELPL
ncbi:MAG TPA: response regulator [Stenomitos sp.]